MGGSVAMVGSLIALSSTARAQTSSLDSAAAQTLFDEGKTQAKQGNFNIACPKFEESQRLEPSSGTLINLADCYEKQGRLAAAWATFLDAATSAHRAENFAREQVARERAQALGPLMPKIVITATNADALAGLVVTRDGRSIGQAQWGVPIPIDLGTHRVAASAPGRQPWEVEVTASTRGEVVKVVVPELAVEPPLAAGPRPAGGPPNGSRSDARPHDPSAAQSSNSLGSQRVVAVAATGIGVIGVALGSTFGLISRSKHDEAQHDCTGSNCREQRGVDLKSQAIWTGNVSTVAFVVAAVGLGAGATLWFTASPRSAPTQPQAGVGLGGVFLRGAF